MQSQSTEYLSLPKDQEVLNSETSTPLDSPRSRDSSRRLLQQRTFGSTSLLQNDLLRGVPLYQILNNFGALLSPSGTISFSGGAMPIEDTFQFSRPVSRIQYFLSHSWRSSRWLKWITLAWFQNFHLALVVANLGAVLCAASSAAWPGVIPCPRWVYDNGTVQVNGWSMVVFTVLFVVTILCAHWWSSIDVFLDKVCIHQTNEELKTLGIRALGGFLKNSEHLLVLYGSDYFDRLWCNYEISLYIALNDVDKVKVLPLLLGPVVLSLAVLTAMGFALISVAFLISPHAPYSQVMGVVMMLVGSLVAGLKVQLQSQRQQLNQMLSTYDVRQARCFCCDIDHVLPTGERIPCDRSFVEEGVEDWFSNPEQSGIENFNGQMRHGMPPQVRKFLGPTVQVPLSLHMVLANAFWWVGVDAFLLTPDWYVGMASLVDNIFYQLNIMAAETLTGYAIDGLLARGVRSYSLYLLGALVQGVSLTMFFCCWDTIMMDPATRSGGWWGPLTAAAMLLVLGMVQAIGYCT